MTELTRRRNRQGDASRRRILEAALGIAAENGYRAATIARITEETGLPASSIFWHFKNKQVLLAEALEHSYQGRRAEVPEWVQTGSPETLEARLVENLTFGARAPRQSDYWRLGLTVALEGADVDPQLSGRFVEIRGYSRGAWSTGGAASSASSSTPANPATWGTSPWRSLTAGSSTRPCPGRSRAA